MSIFLVKKILARAGIIGTIFLLFMVALFIVYILFNTDVIDFDANSLNFTGGGTSSTLPSGTIAKLLESAEKIDTYMADEGYSYSLSNLDSVYNAGNNKNACCATYVSWCLQDAGFISSHEDHSREIYNLLKADSNWTLVEASDYSDMKPGDVGIYSDTEPFRHSNIYAGDNLFWDAGSDEVIKSKGATSHPIPTYVFRYTGS